MSSDSTPWGATGGFTRVCPSCDHTWGSDRHPTSDDAPGPCPECGYGPAEGETIYDWSTCPGCGKTGIPKRNPPAEAFPGQRYCSARCAGLV